MRSASAIGCFDSIEETAASIMAVFTMASWNVHSGVTPSRTQSTKYFMGAYM
jgi:hypothetical protein